MKKIAIYNENCSMSGRQCHDVEITNEGLALHPTTGEENGDVTVYEVSDEEIDRIESMCDHSPAGRAPYFSRVANTLRENL